MLFDQTGTRIEVDDALPHHLVRATVDLLLGGVEIWDRKVRVLRVRWWLVVLLSGVVLGVVELTVLSGTVQFLAVCLGVLFIVFAIYRRAGGTDYNRERPIPPGSPRG